MLPRRQQASNDGCREKHKGTLHAEGGRVPLTKSHIDHRCGAEAVLVRETRPGGNLRRVRVGACNISSLSQDHQLSYISGEMRWLRVDRVVPGRRY